MVWSKDTLLFGPKRCDFLREMLEKDKKNKGVGWNGEGLELKAPSTKGCDKGPLVDDESFKFEQTLYDIDKKETET
ncbi:hypothetical protein HZH68_014552 [Vespula germanica]|uniref:Uncharacterized protein n=1 Tax=Vespula germanica TaxID=30212 RepID=A0A834MTD6_VESGE|nr:hypothetical protein HZH68_014552 [Vespula germanica]